MDSLKERKRLMIEHLVVRGIKDKNVLEAMDKVDRIDFVLNEYKNIAYADNALPLIKNVTISQPYTVAVMLQAGNLIKGQKVLEVGAGSGWSACLIGHIVNPGKVFTVEIDNDVYELAKKNIEKNGLKNVNLIESDGGIGYEKEAPYDRIFITCACKEVPGELLRQLKINGILIAPVGGDFGQQMVKIVKTKNGLKRQYLGEFVFVRMK